VADTLTILHAAGFTAYVDAFAWEPDPGPGSYRHRLWFLSLLGPQQSVKALWARLIKGEVASLRVEDNGATRFCALAPGGPRGWRFFTASLPNAAGYHGVLVPEMAFYTAERSDFLLLPQGEEEAPDLHYRFLNRRLDLPLHKQWTIWLWERGLGSGEIVPLEARGLAAYSCTPDPMALATALTAAIRRRELQLATADRQLAQSA
jgi:hypothetical protein